MKIPVCKCGHMLFAVDFTKVVGTDFKTRMLEPFFVCVNDTCDQKGLGTMKPVWVEVEVKS